MAQLEGGGELMGWGKSSRLLLGNGHQARPTISFFCCCKIVVCWLVLPRSLRCIRKELQTEAKPLPCPIPMGGRVQLGCTRNRAPRTLVLTRLSSPCPGVPRKSITTSGESMETEAGAKLSSHGPSQPEGYSYQTWVCAWALT